MTHLTDEEMYSLPDDPCAGFVAGEKIMSARLSYALAEADSDFSSLLLTQDYMNNVIELAVDRDIQTLAEWQHAKPGVHTALEYRLFKAEVDLCTTRIRLQMARRARSYSVALDAVTKKKLRHILDQMRETVEKLEISHAKRDKLFRRISALQDEIDLEHTGYHAYGALAIELADNAGEVATRLEPVIKMCERIGAAFGLAKGQEQSQAQLPKPSQPKQIEGPKSNKKNGFTRAVDDEIPF